MFDRTTLVLPRQHTEYVTREIHEHRAPTDESVALLKEMEEAARAKIIDAIHVNNTPMECHITFWEDFQFQQRHALIVYCLNGQKHDVTVKIKIGDGIEAVISQIISALADDVARNILAGPIGTALQSGGMRILGGR